MNIKRSLKILATGLFLALPWIGAASAEVDLYCVVNPQTPPYQWIPCSSLNPLFIAPTEPGGQASLQFPNGQPLSLFVDDFGAGTLNTSTRWNRPTTGGGGNATAATNAVGQTTIGTGTTAAGFSLLQSQRTIWDRNPGYNYFQTNINIPIPTVLNAYMLFGFATVPTTPTAAAPATNAAAFEFGVNGKLSAVTFASGTRQLVADLSVAQGGGPVQQSTAGTWTGGCNCTPQITAPKSGLTITDSYKYVIVFRGDNILWYIEQSTGDLALVAYTTRGAVGLDVNQVPVTYLAVANTGTGPTATATMQINQVTVGDTAKNSEPGFDRSAFPTQALTAVNDAVGINAMGAATCTFTTVSNTNVTLVFEATDANGTNWTAITGYPQAGGAGVQTVPSGTNGQWDIPCAGKNQVRMRVSVIGATPTVIATAEASIGSPPVITAVAGNAVGTTPTDRTVTSATGSSQTMMAANATRHSMTITNTGNANCGVNPTGGTAAIAGAGTITLAPLGAYTPRIPTLSAVTVICTAGQPIYGDEN